MKKTIALICALCLCSVATYAQGWAEQNAFVVSGDVYNPANGSTSTIGQIFTVAAVGSGMMVNEGVHNATLVIEDNTDEVCEGYDYSGHGFTRSGSLNHVSVPGTDEVFDTSRYSLAGIELGYDSLINLALTIHATHYNKDTTVLLAGDPRLSEDPTTHKIEQIYSTAAGCDSIVEMLVYRVSPNDTVKQQGRIGHACEVLTSPNAPLQTPDIVDLTQYPLTASELNITHTPDESTYCFPTGDTTEVTWTVTIADSTVTFTQPVIILWPDCPAQSGPDGDGNVYNAVRVLYDCWTQTNLRPENYVGGTPISNGVMSYPGVPNPETYGKLYTYEAMIGASTPDANGNYQGICPVGWHLPDAAKLTEIYTLVEPAALMAEYDWLPEGGTNETGFGLLPAGFYNATTGFYENLYVKAYLWSTTSMGTYATACEWGAGCVPGGIVDYKRDYALSVRCLMNAE